MDPGKLKALFHEALLLRSEERAAFLARACADEEELRLCLERLLKSQNVVPDGPAPAENLSSPNRAKTIVLSMPPDEVNSSGDWPLVSPIALEKAGDAIGRYHLLGELGAGG